MRVIPHYPQMGTDTARGATRRGMCRLAPADGWQDCQHGLAVGSVETRKGLPLCGVTLSRRGFSQSLASSLDRLGRALRRPALFSFLATPETSNSLLAGGRSRMDGCAFWRQTGLGTVAIIVVSRQSILPATYRAAGVISSTGKRGRAVSASMLTARHTISGTCRPISFQTRDQLDCQVTYRSPRPVHAYWSSSARCLRTATCTHPRPKKWIFTPVTKSAVK